MKRARFRASLDMQPPSLATACQGSMSLRLRLAAGALALLVIGDQEANSQPKGKRRRRIWISIGIILALLVIFHRPILLGAIHWFAVHRAAKEHLKLSFRAEGNVFTALTIRNLHVVPTGPAAIEI